MPELELNFGFERSVVRVSDGTTFQPLKDAIDRWACRSPSPYAFLGENFQILYELASGKFVILYYSCCHQSTVDVSGRTVEIWVADTHYEARPIPSTTAVRMLMKAEFEIPERLNRYLAAIEEEDSVVVAELAPRPISYWAQGDFVGRQCGRKAHTVNAIESTRDIVEFGMRAVQQIRHTGPAIRDLVDPLRVLEVSLYSTYPIDPVYWWGAKDRIPPATVGVAELWWPARADAVRATLRRIQDLLRAPLSVAAAVRGALFSPERPTTEEQKAGEEALRGCVDELERLVLELRAGLDALEAPRDIPADEKPNVKRPPDSAFHAFRLLVLGMKQKDVATRLLRYGITADQGTISRWKKQVWKWLEACNVFPPMPEPVRRKPSAIDPSKIDMGANQEHRTPRQQRKNKEE